MDLSKIQHHGPEIILYKDSVTEPWQTIVDVENILIQTCFFTEARQENQGWKKKEHKDTFIFSDLG